MNIRETNVNIPIIVSTLKEHDKIKHRILDLIDQSTNEYLTGTGELISRTDWKESDDNSREYLEFVMPFLVEHIAEIFKKYNTLGIKIGNVWFQQYNENDLHDWHVHGLCHFTIIYFLELPDESIKTEIKDMFGELVPHNAAEGDIIVFPSCLYHRSPINTTGKRKTIISFNINFTVDL
jgi:hypothetical protein